MTEGRSGVHQLSRAARRCVVRSAQYASRDGRSEVRAADLLDAIAETDVGAALRDAGFGGLSTAPGRTATRFSQQARSVLIAAVREAHAYGLRQAGVLHVFAAAL